MMIAIMLTKEDIETTAIGFHYQIKTKDGLMINFSPDAIDELINDIAAIREYQKENPVK